MREYRTDEIFTDPQQMTMIPSLEDLPAGTTRFIDIHVYDQLPEGEEAPSIEGTLRDGSPELDQHTMSDEHGTQERVKPRSPGHRRVYPLLFVIGALCIVVVGVVFLVSLLPLFTLTARVTIVPVTKHISTT